MPITTAIANRINIKRLDRIEHFMKHPEDVQQKTFQKLLEKASATAWGKMYGYSSINTVREYQSRVPVQTYETLVPFVERLGNGEPDILWPGKILWFARSSGTTSTKSKFIPMTDDSLEECHFAAAKDILAIYTKNYPSSRVFTGKALTLGGSHRIDQFSNRSLSGDLSAILIENAPSWVELIRVPKKKVALIEDFELKLELIAKTTVKSNVTSFSGVPSWYLTLIKYVLSYTGKSHLHEVWPNLEVFFHGGISFTPYREVYKKLIPGAHMHYMETYNASEGFFGIQDEPSLSDMLLMLDYGIFFEFIPAGKTGQENPPSFTIGEVEKGVNYAIVISTSGGLWRYLIGDTIVFTDLNPPRFRISGRTKHFINAFGEEVIIDNAEQALEAACKATGAIISEYTAGPVFMDTSHKGSHEWIIEFEKDPADPELFRDILDKTLQSVNSDYEAKRFRDINLVMPKIHSVPPGTFHNWMKSKNKLGGQNKVPRLSNTREYLDDILNTANIFNV